MTPEEAKAAGYCHQCVTPGDHHPHYGHPSCDVFGEYSDGCEAFMWCYCCGESWPCTTKRAHVAERRAVPS